MKKGMRRVGDQHNGWWLQSIPQGPQGLHANCRTEREKEGEGSTNRIQGQIRCVGGRRKGVCTCGRIKRGDRSCTGLGHPTDRPVKAKLCRGGGKHRGHNRKMRDLCMPCQHIHQCVHNKNERDFPQRSERMGVQRGHGDVPNTACGRLSTHPWRTRHYTCHPSQDPEGGPQSQIQCQKIWPRESPLERQPLAGTQRRRRLHFEWLLHRTQFPTRHRPPTPIPIKHGPSNQAWLLQSSMALPTHHCLPPGKHEEKHKPVPEISHAPPSKKQHQAPLSGDHTSPNGKQQKHAYL